MAAQRAKTVYVRLPHTIRDPLEVRNLFPVDIDVKVKLPRQSSRGCHVTFSNIEDKIKNVEYIKKKTINDKKIFIRSLNEPQFKTKIQKPEKKVIVPEPKSAPKITRMIYVANINPKSTINDLKKVFGDVRTICFISKGKNKHPTKEAVVKLADGKLTAEYLRKERSPPMLHGNKLVIKSDKRNANRKKSKNAVKSETESVESKIDNGKVKKEIKKKKNRKMLTRKTLIEIGDDDIKIKEETITEEDDNKFVDS